MADYNDMSDGFSDAEVPSKTSPETNEKTDSGESTALLPKAFFSGKELTPGNECKVRIQKVYDDQVEVSYVPHSDTEEEKEGEESSEGEAGSGYEDEMSMPRDDMAEMMR